MESRPQPKPQGKSYVRVNERGQPEYLDDIGIGLNAEGAKAVLKDIEIIERYWPSASPLAELTKIAKKKSAAEAQRRASGWLEQAERRMTYTGTGGLESFIRENYWNESEPQTAEPTPESRPRDMEASEPILDSWPEGEGPEVEGAERLPENEGLTLQEHARLRQRRHHTKRPDDVRYGLIARYRAVENARVNDLLLNCDTGERARVEKIGEHELTVRRGVAGTVPAATFAGRWEVVGGGE